MPNFFVKWNFMLQTASLNDWKSYLRWHLINTFAPYLSTPFVEQDFKLSTVLSGAKNYYPDGSEW